MAVNEKDFVERRQADWQKLHALIDMGEHNISRLSGRDLRDFGRLYRRAARDLAVVRTHSGNPGLRAYLNDLIGRGHGVLYKRPGKPLLQALTGAALEAARVVRRRWPFVMAAVSIGVVGAIFARNAVSMEPSTLDVIVPGGLKGSLEQWKTQEFGPVDTEQALAMTGFYIYNNTLVAVRIVAGSVTLGSLTVNDLLENGAVMGAFWHELSGTPRLSRFLVSVYPHGVPEISGIFIASAAGLLVGYTFLNPGRRTRVQAFRLVARDVAHLLGLGVVLIWIAAPIEASFSFNAAVSDPGRVLVGTTLLFLLLAYITLAGRTNAPR